ncbi:MAG: flavin reductase oxidoreductase [Subtercola sp.]|nr:flavin reductase oxidoreductase [Subtercola sp.]
MSATSTTRADVDFARTFRNVLGHYSSGITVITSIHEGHPVGFTCQSFFSVSIEPALVAFSVSKTSSTYPLIRNAKSCTINVLSADQSAVSQSFARSGSDKWAGIVWQPGAETATPRIDGVLAWLECEIDAEIDAGDHVVVLCRVLDLDNHPDASPLLYFRGRYAQLAADQG